jgi:hypothetical protein
MPVMRRISIAGIAAGALLALAVPLSAPAAEGPPPANDMLASPQVIHSLPATIAGTTVAATVEPQEATSSCSSGSEHSVWYSVRAPSAERLAVNLQAGGTLDATIDVFHAVRSQLQSVDCARTDSHGRAAFTFKASKNGLYLIRVAAQAGSQLAGFTLEVFLPTPAVNPPGPRLPAGGVSGQVDRVQNINAAYSVMMRTGVSYLINLANKTSHGCVSGGLFAPGTHSFEEATPLLHLRCGGFRLFTPGPGQGGLYSIQLTPKGSFAGVQRFRVQAAAAGPAETAPGIALGNYGRAHGRLDGNGVHVLRLYRIDIHTHSNLALRLRAPDSAEFNLQLRNINGNVIECQCGGSGPQTLVHQLKPGRYYAVVSTRNDSLGNYTLIRQSRTITSTSVSFSSSRSPAGQGLGINVKVSPAVSGPVIVDIERFDPVFGWQFFRQETGSVSGGTTSLPFAAPAVGRWRVNARYGGSRTASPSAVGFSYLLVS